MLKPRIGIFSHDFYPIQGGQGRNFSELFIQLSRRDTPFEFWAFSPCENDLPNHVPILTATNHIPGSQLHYSAGLNLAIPDLIRRFDLRAALFNGGPGGIFLLRRLPIPLAYCVNHTYSQQIRHLPSQNWKRIFLPLEQRSYALADALVAISETTRRELAAAYGFENRAVSLIPVGVDQAAFSLSAVPPEPDSILYVGRLDERKGIQFLLESFLLVREKHPYARLQIVGRGPWRGRIERWIAEHRLADQVALWGEVPDADLPGWYHRCSVLVVPSLLEGLGITALEGLASGIPVVAADVPGLRSVLRHDRNGLLVPAGDRAALAQAVSALLTDPTYRTRLRLEGFRTVQDEYSWELVTARYLDVFESLFQPQE